MPTLTTNIRNLTRAEMEDVLRRHTVGRIAFLNGRRVDIEPISYVFADGALYGRAAPGTRTNALKSQPWVAVQVDDIRGPFDWESVVVKGSVYVVEPSPMSPLRERYDRALRALRSAMPEVLTDRDRAPNRTIVFRLHIDEMEGRAAGERLA